jgi:hypothetical protein
MNFHHLPTTGLKLATWASPSPFGDEASPLRSASAGHDPADKDQPLFGGNLIKKNRSNHN